MNQKRLYDAAMIFVLGMCPLGFEYLKQNVEKTTLIQKIQSDIEQHQAKDRRLFKPKISVKDLLLTQQSTKVSQSIDQRIQLLRRWKKSLSQKYLPEVFSIASLHTIGGLMYPSAFFLSILSYFIIYQMNFVNEYMILGGRPALFKSSSFDFQKINNLYLYLSLSGLGIAGLGKGMAKLNKKAMQRTFK